MRPKRTFSCPPGESVKMSEKINGINFSEHAARVGALDATRRGQKGLKNFRLQNDMNGGETCYV